jgi:hypothetical protein
VEIIGDVISCLHLLAKARIHDIFHVGLLKKFEGVSPTTMVPLRTTQHGRVLQTPAKVLRATLNRGIWEILVSWQHKPASETTWEKVDAFKLAYPDIHLKDKQFLREEGNVIDSFIARHTSAGRNR